MPNRTCSVEDCERTIHSRGWCSKHYAHNRLYGSPFKPCRTCKKPIGLGPGQHIFCSEECRPECSVDTCHYKVRGGSDICPSHRQQLKTTGEVTPRRRWAKDWICVVCGSEVKKGSGRRKHCSPGCQATDSAWRKTGECRPLSAPCAMCGKDIDLRARNDGGRLTRTDIIWCRDCGRDSSEVLRFKRYGVTPKEYAAAQAAGCEICGRTDKPLHVDHDHACCPTRGGKSPTCGKCVRGFLCGSCNRSIGMMKDDTARLRRAIAYLERPAS